MNPWEDGKRPSKNELQDGSDFVTRLAIVGVIMVVIAIIGGTVASIRDANTSEPIDVKSER